MKNVFGFFERVMEMADEVSAHDVVVSAPKAAVDREHTKHLLQELLVVRSKYGEEYEDRVRELIDELQAIRRNHQEVTKRKDFT